MLKTAITLAATVAATLLPTIASAADEQRIDFDGETYVYTTTTAPEGKVIEGHGARSDESFRLVVKGDRVTGTANGRRVAFRVQEARGAYRNVALTR